MFLVVLQREAGVDQKSRSSNSSFRILSDEMVANGGKNIGHTSQCESNPASNSSDPDRRLNRRVAHAAKR